MRHDDASSHPAQPPLNTDTPETPLTSETLIEVEHLRDAGTPRSGGEDDEHVKALTDVEDRLPPIIVHRPTMRVIDGMHRLRAAKLRGARRIRARYFEGDEADAFVLAVRTNVSHGLPLSLNDRRAAAARIVATHPRWSDRRIAAATGLAARTVASLRREADVDGTADGARRIGQDGKERPVSSAEGRRIAGELIAEDPELSLRAVAREAGISPETVRDVRSRIRRGENPAPPRGTVNRSGVEPERAEGGSGLDGQTRRAGGVRRVPVPPRRGAHRRSLLRRLRNDPALRLSEPGRALLRLLDAQAIGEEGWRRIAASVPPHSRQMTVQAALGCAQAWQEFAQRLDPELESAEPPNG
ncbi:ParB/RepB/Spo0J family partition protein [Streptomyces sp. NPDC058676]|uniref:ParB/RepB/Spo0J family partition protein n=1 Tax=Streptomyces sp. NPDC058676 TaxID=3346593 RepID=UPI0036628EA9